MAAAVVGACMGGGVLTCVVLWPVQRSKAPPKHTLAANASVAGRQERAQDGVMVGPLAEWAPKETAAKWRPRNGGAHSACGRFQAQLLARGEADETAAAAGASYQEEHTCHLYG